MVCSYGIELPPLTVSAAHPPRICPPNGPLGACGRHSESVKQRLPSHSATPIAAMVTKAAAAQRTASSLTRFADSGAGVQFVRLQCDTSGPMQPQTPTGVGQGCSEKHRRCQASPETAARIANLDLVIGHVYRQSGGSDGRANDGPYAAGGHPHPPRVLRPTSLLAVPATPAGSPTSAPVLPSANGTMGTGTAAHPVGWRCDRSHARRPHFRAPPSN
jgi:hypothetical protein